jgi:exosortase D (VPLPA-CTERM-specific)
MAVDSTHPDLGTGHRTSTLAGLAWFALAVAAALPILWFGFERLAQEWARPEFRFKAVVPVFALFLFLQVLRSVPPAPVPPRGRWLGAAMTVGALLLALFGNVINIDDFVFLSIIGWVAGMVVIGFGLPRALAFWAPVASLFLMVPLPRFVIAPITQSLQTFASELGMGLLRLLGIPARVEGQILDFGIYRLPVADATGGLVSFLPVMLVFFFFATVYRGPLWSRLMPLLLAAPVMVALTAVRVALLGLAIDRAGPEAGERLLQLTDNWVFLALCVAVLLVVVLGAQRLAGHRTPLRGRLDLDLGGLGGQVGRLATIAPSRALIATAVVTLLLALVFVVGPSRPGGVVEREPFRHFPPDIGAWTGTSGTITPEVAGILNADDYVFIDYFKSGERAPVNFWSAFYYRQDQDRGGIHSPQDCLPLDGWNILSFRPAEVTVDGRSGAQTLTVNRAIIEKGGSRALVYYWFEGRGRHVANERMARLLVKLDGLTRGRTDGALVRYVTEILPDEPEAEADARLQKMMGETVDLLPRFIPA